MKLKERLRVQTQKHPWFERVWLRTQWMVVKHNARRYSDLEFTQKLWNKLPSKKGESFLEPHTYDAQMFFLKLSNRDPLITKCSDKHAVQEYIKDCGYEDILKKEYACFDSVEQIDFSKLPSPCYLKCNHASGMNWIYRKEDKHDLKHIKWKFNFLLAQNPYYLSREWNYKDIPPKIVCEELLQMPDGVSDIPELQFFCFNGEPRFIIYNLGLADKTGAHANPIRWGLWPDFTLIEEATKLNHTAEAPPMPEGYEQMIKCARRLSKPFPHVRVDLFVIEGRIIFNELTFYSGGGLTLSRTKSVQNGADEWLDISNYKIAEDAQKRHTRQEIKNGSRC